MKLTVPELPQESDYEKLKKGLTSYNASHTGELLREKIASFIKDDSSNIVGGILAEINWDWMHVQGLWVDEGMRNRGWGTKLLNTMEAYALSKNTLNIRLETTSFQALDFYIQAGYTVFGELSDMPKGHTSYFLQKQLSH